MRKRTRILFFSILSIAPLILIMNQTYGRALSLLILLVLGAIIFEKREASRQFYRAISKLLICVDYEAFCFEGEKVRSRAMFPFLVKEQYRLIRIIALYHKSDLEMGTYAGVVHEKSLQFWSVSYNALVNAQRFNGESLKALERLRRKLPRYMKALAAERYAAFTLDLIDAADAAQMEEAQLIRSSLSAQLLLAEATDWLGNHTNDAKRAISYKKTAVNLSKGLLTRRY